LIIFVKKGKFIMVRTIWILTLSALLCSLGCTSSKDPAVVLSPEASKYLLTTEPADAKAVAAAKKDVEDGAEVILVGRIGGSESPFVAGRASFTIVDTSLVPCSERPGDSCPTPWDYCCDTDQLPGSMAAIKVVDDAGKTLPIDAKTGLGLKELQTVVVRGKAKRDEAGNLSVLATGIFVKK
jgi:hypothetical protein